MDSHLHFEEIKFKQYSTGPNLELTRTKKEGKTEEQLEKGHRGRTQATGDRLARNSKNIPDSCLLEQYSQWPKLPEE